MRTPLWFVLSGSNFTCGLNSEACASWYNWNSQLAQHAEIWEVTYGQNQGFGLFSQIRLLPVKVPINQFPGLYGPRDPKISTNQLKLTPNTGVSAKINFKTENFDFWPKCCSRATRPWPGPGPPACYTWKITKIEKNRKKLFFSLTCQNRLKGENNVEFSTGWV